MTRWLRHQLFAPVLVLAALGWGTALGVFLLVGPDLGGWARAVLAYCFGWDMTTRAYRLDAVLLVTLEPPLFALVVGLFYADELRAFGRRPGGRVVGGAALLGFYHSHPDHPARPSQYDLDHAWPTFAFVIVAVERGEPGEMRSWRLRPDRSAFDEEAIVVNTPTEPYNYGDPDEFRVHPHENDIPYDWGRKDG